MLAFDRALIERDFLAFDRDSARTFDLDGRMHVANCRISKANVCPYYGREIPNAGKLGLQPNKIYMLYRDPVELEKGAASFRNLPLLTEHVGVNAHDAKQEITVGTVGAVAFDGTYLVADQLTIWARDGIDLVESREKAELSCSYRYQADMSPGFTAEGVAFDGVMRHLVGNHVALVKAGRAGSDVVVNDEHPSELPKMKRPLLIAQLLAAGLVAPFASDEARLSFDSQLALLTAKDAEPEDMEDDPENPGSKRKKLNPGKGKPSAVGGGLASDEQINAVIAQRGLITTEAAQTMANDAATRASADAVAKVNALHEARKAVEPLVGVVAMDSAEAVYRFALEKSGVAVDGVHASAFPALVAQVIQHKTTVVKPPVDGLAADAASVFPGLASIAVG